MDIPAPTKPTPHRTLRIITIVSMIPALSLLIPSAIVTHTATPTLGLIPMGLSCVVSLTALGIRVANSSVKLFIPGADFLAAVLLMVDLVASWIMIASDWSMSANEAMLASYGLVPLMINFCIHTYLVLRSPASLFRPRPCPNCAYEPPSVIPRWQWQGSRPVALPTDAINNSQPTTYRIPAQRSHAGPSAAAPAGGPGHSRSSKEIYAPFIRPYDDDAVDAEARESSEFQTSGFNTPRQSAETLRSEVRESEGRERGAVVVNVGDGLGDRKDAGSLV